MADDLDAPFRPNWASPPGDSIQDALEHNPIDIGEFGRRMGISRDEVVDLLKGNFRIMPEHAERLSEMLGGSPLFWLRRDAQYLESLARLSQDRATAYAAIVPTETTCPECRRTSHHPMDVFFKWCAACKLNYSDVEYRDDERGWLGQLHDDHPELSLRQVVDLHRNRR